MNRKKIILSALVLFICIGGIKSWKNFRSPGNIVTGSGDQRFLGSPSAKLWVVEYMDFQCKICRETYFFLHDSLKKHPKDIYLQVRFFPLSNHRNSFKSALYARCAASQGKFWLFADALFQNQAEWSEAEKPEALFEKYAKSSGVDLKKLNECLKDPVVADKIKKEKESGLLLGIRYTPTVFVGANMVIGYEDTKKSIETYFSAAGAGGKEAEK